MDRDGLIAALRAIGQIKVLERDGEVQAYGCARVWGRGVVIGPVVAETREDARSIIAALAADHEGRFLRIDVTRRSDLSPWLEAIGLPQVDAVVAMAKGRPATRPAARLSSRFPTSRWVSPLVVHRIEHDRNRHQARRNRRDRQPRDCRALAAHAGMVSR
jgi:hypothetical protein